MMHSRHKEWRDANPDRWHAIQRRASLKRKYGISEADYDAMLEAQGGRCAICHTDKPSGKRRWHVDHCHETGRVRGLLCHYCNVALGNFRDDPARLAAAIEYLEAK